MIKKMTPRTSILAAVCAAVSVMSLALFVAAQEPPAQAPQAQARHPRIDRAVAELGLTPDQVKALEAFRKARMEERQAFRQKMDKLRTERDKIFTPGQRKKIEAFRSSRLGRMGVAGRARMAENRAFRRGWARGVRRGWRRGRIGRWRRW